MDNKINNKINIDNYDTPFDYNILKYNINIINGINVINDKINKLYITTPKLEIYKYKNNNIQFLLNNSIDNIYFFTFIKKLYEYNVNYIYNNYEKWFNTKKSLKEINNIFIKPWKIKNNKIILNLKIKNNCYFNKNDKVIIKLRFNNIIINENNIIFDFYLKNKIKDIDDNNNNNNNNILNIKKYKYKCKNKIIIKKKINILDKYEIYNNNKIKIYKINNFISNNECNNILNNNNDTFLLNNIKKKILRIIDISSKYSNPLNISNNYNNSIDNSDNRIDNSDNSDNNDNSDNRIDNNDNSDNSDNNIGNNDNRIDNNIDNNDNPNEIKNLWNTIIFLEDNNKNIIFKNIDIKIKCKKGDILLWKKCILLSKINNYTISQYFNK